MQSYLALAIVHGSKLQQSIKDSTSPILDKVGSNTVRRIVEALLLIGRFIDMTLLMPSNEIILMQIDATIVTINACIWLLDYMNVHSSPSIAFKKSDMIL